MTQAPRKYGRPVGPVTDPATGEVLGWIYEWDTGETQVMAAALLRDLADGAAPAQQAGSSPPRDAPEGDAP